ncbi:hypothetical protein WR25_16928 [Diploscapter pachys]|uniref:Uncharacterized protein n=1 Tax=Diploscapter pachys TaxID=2018661 RepID=A0A2A2JP51_9BILA|nr:hypothetical protein WR25_16928 [Diploscapter pachys]
MRMILFRYYEYVIISNLVSSVKIVCVANGEAENDAEDQNYPHVRMSLIDSESTATDSNGLFASEQDPGYDEDESFLTQLIKARWSNKCVFF